MSKCRLGGGLTRDATGRSAQGKSRREAIRCLKRYVARDLYKHIIGSTPQPTSDDLPAAA
jgi:hypothetical protein